MRTGVTCEGREAMGVILTDLTDDLPFPPDVIMKFVTGAHTHFIGAVT